MRRDSFTFTKYYCDQIKEDGVGRHVVGMEELRNSYKILIEKHEGK
jgi:hypothetical protein